MTFKKEEKGWVRRVTLPSANSDYAEIIVAFAKIDEPIATLRVHKSNLEKFSVGQKVKLHIEIGSAF